MHEQIGQNPEWSFFADYQPEHFTSEEKEILEPFFSNSDKPVFVVFGLPPTMIAALIGRHSQSPDSMRRILLDEFVKDREAAQRWAEHQTNLGGLREWLDLKKASMLLERHFVKFGHDSLVAPIPLVLGFERVSQLGAKGIEDTRIGLSPIERSTRYGFFGEKVDGRYLYARSPVIMTSPHAGLYEEAINSAIDLYVQLQEPVAEAYRGKFPKTSERKIKQMTFDTTRVLLVAANLTNLGAMVDGQAAEYMMVKLLASELAEHREIGQMLVEEIAKVAPTLVQRVQRDFGQQAIQYRASLQESSKKLAQEYLSGMEPETVKQGLDLVYWDAEGEEKVIAKILWPGCNLSDQQVLKAVGCLSDEDKLRIIDSYLGERPDRRSKPGRAFEEAVLSYQIVCRFAEWRDLQRNRILTPHWRLLDYSLGVDIGEDLIEFGFEQPVQERLEKLAEAHSAIAKDYPVEAQYIVAFGALMPYLVTLNFRELVHIAELRTDPGAHPAYAKVASEMAKQAKEIYPLLGGAFQFVNWR